MSKSFKIQVFSCNTIISQKTHVAVFLKNFWVCKFLESLWSSHFVWVVLKLCFHILDVFTGVSILQNLSKGTDSPQEVRYSKTVVLYMITFPNVSYVISLPFAFLFLSFFFRMFASSQSCRALSFTGEHPTYNTIFWSSLQAKSISRYSRAFLLFLFPSEGYADEYYWDILGYSAIYLSKMHRKFAFCEHNINKH